MSKVELDVLEGLSLPFAVLLLVESDLALLVLLLDVASELELVTVAASPSVALAGDADSTAAASSAASFVSWGEQAASRPRAATATTATP